MLGYILLFTFIAMILSLFLVSLFLLNQKIMTKISFYLVSFAAGALLAAGFTDTLPEAVELNHNAFIFTTIFVAVFFVIERVFLDIHHHDGETNSAHKSIPVPLLMFGDGLHNFIDGISIASAFVISAPVGILTSLAVFVHEIPHELGDFGLLIHLGYSRFKVLVFNFLSGVVAFAGALLGYYLSEKLSFLIPILLAVTSANFIYLSLSDLLPQIHSDEGKKATLIHSISFILGITFIIVLGNIFKE
jgi:zinc and cadmium transporter